MSTKSFGLIVLAVIMVGCATPMPNQHYTTMGNFAGLFERCYEANYIDANLHAQTLTAYQIILNTWSYDQQRLRSHVARAYNTSSPQYSSCTNAKTQANQLIAEARKYQASMQAANQALSQAQQNSNEMYQQSVQALNQQMMQIPAPNTGFSSDKKFTPQPFYSEEDCMGTAANGICYGTVDPSAQKLCCHGSLINGQCHGSVVPCK